MPQRMQAMTMLRYSVTPRKIFHCPQWQTWFTIVLGTGASMAYEHHFIVAYIILSVCLLWAEGLWITSDYLTNKKQRSLKRPSKSSRLQPDELAAIMRKKRRTYLRHKFAGIAFFALGGIGAGWAISSLQSDWELQQNFGVLSAANDADPPLPNCSAPPGFFRIYAGGGMYAIKSGFAPDTGLVSIGGVEPIRLTQLSPNKVEISGDIYGNNGEIAYIRDNHFEVNSNVGFRPKKSPDKHTLIVYDDWHRAVLDIRFLNPHAIRLRGIFLLPGHAPVTIDDQKIQMAGGASIAAACVVGAGTAIGLP